MRWKTRFAAGVVAAATLTAGTVVTAAPAVAATSHRVAIDGMATKADCQYVQNTWRAHIIRKGGKIYGGEGCLYGGAARKWLFSISYTL